MKVKNYSLPERHIALIKEIKKEKSIVSKSEVIRRAIEEYATKNDISI